jgi:hypothetical protein
MNIPSNFSLEEIIKYVELDSNVNRLVEESIDKIIKLEKELTSVESSLERKEEELAFCRDFIEISMNMLDRAKSKVELTEAKKQIIIDLKNSCIEL